MQRLYNIPKFLNNISTACTVENKGVESSCFDSFVLLELVEPGGIEPPTPCLQSRCSPS
jgi:hypothetical protein